MVPYAGDVTPGDAYAALAADPRAVLVDCRTRTEWELVGVPVVERVVFLEWMSAEGLPNGRFLDELRSRVGPEDPVYFLCRSGQRSAAAAAVASRAGYTAFNVADGFEGTAGPDGTRAVAGWKAAGLPWRRS